MVYLMGFTRPRNPSCVITVLLMTCLAASIVIYFLSHCQCIAAKDWTPTSDSEDFNCNTKPVVLGDLFIVKTLASYSNFTQAWSDAEEKAKQPLHEYIEKRHSVALYTYTNVSLKYPNNIWDNVNIRRPQKEAKSLQRKLSSSLSEAIRILKHSQLTCLKTTYRTQIILDQDITNKQIRFGTFLLVANETSRERAATCFKVNTCLGADISYYSALSLKNQVLVPPNEVFKVYSIHPDDAEDCNVTFKLESNFNCVYDTERKMLHPITASPPEGFWCVAVLVFIITVWLVVLLIIVKKYCKKNPSHSILYLQPVTDCHTEAGMKMDSN
ncbi:ecto-ADP-ribosyltransferase 4-like [Stigmatopora argus]